VFYHSLLGESDSIFDVKEGSFEKSRAFQKSVIIISREWFEKIENILHQ
jgi:hypothetical protein